MAPISIFGLAMGGPCVVGAQQAPVPDKPPVDSTATRTWEALQGVDLSPDGEYVSYSVQNDPAGMSHFVLKAVHGDWKYEATVPSGGPLWATFTGDSRLALLTRPGDTLVILHLGQSGSAVEYLTHVANYSLLSSDSGETIVYQQPGPDGQLAIRDLATGTETQYGTAKNHWVSPDGSALLVERQVASSPGDSSQSLEYVKIADGQKTAIWQGKHLGGTWGGVTMNRETGQIAFLVSDSIDGRPNSTLWYFKPGTPQAVQIFSGPLAGADSGLLITGLRQFSKDGGRLFVSVSATHAPLPKATGAAVDVWSYTDSRLQSQQLADLDGTAGLGEHAESDALILLDTHRVIHFDHKNDWPTESTGEWALINHADSDGAPNDRPWNVTAERSNYLVSMVTGDEKPLTLPPRVWGASLSPGGRYAVYYDPASKNYVSYETATGVVHTITAQAHTTWTLYGYDGIDRDAAAEGPAGWIAGDSGVLLNDQNDIWLADPAGVKAPINITNGYGRAHDIVFRLENGGFDRVVPSTDTLLLSAFNRRTKDNGFFRASLRTPGDPVLLTMGPYLFDIPEGRLPQGANFSPTKAKRANVYLIRRETANSGPDYFVTADFHTLTQVTDVHPERKYNWMTSELVEWKTPGQGLNQGILYKPENFDPSKKYPVIFYYYEVLSDGLHAYMPPEVSDGALNVSNFVSNGYLVFSPDIHYKQGHIGQSALNSVVSAAEHLAKEPWVDKTKMGLQGLSFGAIETNYIITHSHLFAAASTSSGVFDFISASGGLFGDGGSLGGFYEVGQNRMGATLWQRPDLYIENSDIFHADQVTTPVLMMATKKDGICPFTTAVEFFTAMRRLGKRAWMLQYDDGNHGVSGKSADDFTIRMTQFFDHYLKGAPAPKWMTEGIPARLKGIETGYELDTSGKEPGPGLVAPGHSGER